MYIYPDARWRTAPGTENGTLYLHGWGSPGLGWVGKRGSGVRDPRKQRSPRSFHLAGCYDARWQAPPTYILGTDTPRPFASFSTSNVACNRHPPSRHTKSSATLLRGHVVCSTRSPPSPQDPRGRSHRRLVADATERNKFLHIWVGEPSFWMGPVPTLP